MGGWWGGYTAAVAGVETIFASPLQYVLCCLVLVVAEGVYVLFGFGAGMIAVGSLALFMPELRDVVVLLLLINLPPEIWVVSSGWRRIRWQGVLLISVGIAIGVDLGTRVLHWGEPTFLIVLLGAFLVVAGGAFLLAPADQKVRWPRWVAVPVGLVSGFLAGTFGTGGPPLVFYYQLGGMDKAMFRGNLMAIFLIVTILRVPRYALEGLITVPRLWSALVVMPAVLVGAWLGNRIHLEVSERTFRRMVSIALILIGLLLLVQRVV
jgi:uncharacterized membrane protein YfcA